VEILQNLIILMVLKGFVTLMWKNWKTELGSSSRLIWNVVGIMVVGASFGAACIYVINAFFVPILMTLYMFLLAGLLGRMVAINLIRDRRTKFRLNLHLLGVHQTTYITTTMLFYILWGILNVACLMMSLVLFSEFMEDPDDPFPFSNEQIISFAISTVTFILAYMGMCATMSALIRNYDFAGEIIDKVTFLGIFIPAALVISYFMSAIAAKDAMILNILLKVGWSTIWLPNMSYLQIAVKNAFIVGDLDLPEEFTPDSIATFDLVLICQFIGYIILFMFIDRYISTDTGGQRQLIGSSSWRLKEEDNNSTYPINDIRAGLLSTGLRGSDTSDIPKPNAVMPATPTDAAKQSVENTLKVRRLTKRYGSVYALYDLNLDLVSGQISCLLGHNGAGKSTLIDVLTAFQSPTDGGVYYNNRNIHVNIERLYAKVGYSSSHDPLLEDMTVSDVLYLTAYLRWVGNYKETVELYANELGLRQHLSKYVRECSGGVKKQLAVACALIGEPPIILLDEPTTGMDPAIQRNFWKLLGKLKKPERIILLCTNNLDEAEKISNDIIIMARGSIAVRGTPEEIKGMLQIGYSVVVKDAVQRKNEIISLATAVEKNVTFNESRLESKGELVAEITRGEEDSLVYFTKQLSREGISYEIHAPSLEEAYIRLGDKELFPGDEEYREEVMQNIFSKTYSSCFPFKIWVLLKRRFDLLLQSGLQVLSLLVLIFFPSLVYILVTRFIYDAKNRTKGAPKFYLDMHYFTIINIICIIYYTFSCGFFGMVPVIERVSRIRYMMKMSRINCLYYFPTLFVTDSIIAFILVGTTYTVSYVATYDIYGNFSKRTFLTLALNLFLWLLSFISQSYFLSFFFKSKEIAFKQMTNIFMLANLGIIAVLHYVTRIQNEKVETDFEKIFYTLFPAYPNIAFCNNALNQLKINTGDMDEAVYYSLTCTGIFFFIALVLDYKDSRIKRADNSGAPAMAAPHQQQDIFDPEVVEQERQLAYQDTAEYPLQVRGVSKYFYAFKALDNVSIALKPSETLGLIGPNGAGKSTLFNIVSNYFSPTTGDLLYNGKHLDQITSFYDKTGLCAQDDIIWPELSVDQHLSFYGHLKGVDADTLKLWKSLLGLESFGSFSASHLSTGMKRKLCYIISMMSNPTYKFLDEPTSGLDPVSRKLMRKLISAQKRIYGGTCVFTTHTMRDAEDLCDRVAILVNGKLTCIDTVNNLRAKTGGVNVSFMRNLANPNRMADEQNIYSVYGNTFPESLENGQPILIDRTERKLVFFAYKAEDIPKKLETLMNLKKQGIIFDFEISQRSLEDLFLYLARHQQMRQN
jgi:ATP-binding cassette subfamily A (ABC1) protein 3